MSELQKSANGRNIQFYIEPDLVVDGDADLLKIALNNLYENALKFTKNEEVAKIEFGKNGLADKSVYYIKDNGAGFDMNYANKLFRPFHRLHNNKEFAGTGVGLSTVQRIIHRHGGEIWAEAEVGNGAIFYFTINRVSQ